MFAKQNAQSANPKVRMLAAEKRFKSAEAAVQRAEQDLERAAENVKKVKREPAARVLPFTTPPPPPLAMLVPAVSICRYMTAMGSPPAIALHQPSTQGRLAFAGRRLCT